MTAKLIYHIPAWKNVRHIAYDIFKSISLIGMFFLFQWYGKKPPTFLLYL